MARLTILIALLAALLLVTHTCASQCGCQKQLQRVNLRHCEKHIMQRIQQQEEQEEEDVLNLRGIHYILPGRGGQQQEQEQELEQCCKQLSELNSPKCQCQALQYIMEKQCEQLQGKEMQQLQKELKCLPSVCGLGPLRRCDLSCED